MNGQTFIQERAMAKVTKQECLSIDDASTEIGHSRASLYNYMNILGIQRYRFALDRRTYIHKTDVERIKQFLEENRT